MSAASPPRTSPASSTSPWSSRSRPTRTRVINSLDLSGRLTRWNFGDVDEPEHFWFRARLVQQLAANAAHTVLFPRPNLGDDMHELVGIDITAHPERHTIVPEGIDLETSSTAASPRPPTSPRARRPPRRPRRARTRLLEQLPAERRGLPLVVSVGRFHRVKGMATIVEAWANGPLRDARQPAARSAATSSRPSADEREQLDLIDAIVAPTAAPRARPDPRRPPPNDTVARWVAAARFGVPGLAAPRGIYVCGSLKEEFGIALLEAMGAGLMVVAPDGGGPATYVERRRHRLSHAAPGTPHRLSRGDASRRSTPPHAEIDDDARRGVARDGRGELHHPGHGPRSRHASTTSCSAEESDLRERSVISR